MKRFTETLKWEDPWFRKLTPELKLLWQWLLDHCDPAGVIDPDLELASFQIGYAYPYDTLSSFGDRLIMLDCGKWWIPKFIGFQYGALSLQCKAHSPVFASLKKHAIGYPKGMDTLLGRVQEKEEREDKEKVKVQDKEEVAIQHAVKLNGNHLASESLTNGRASAVEAAAQKIRDLRPKEWNKPKTFSAMELHALHDAMPVIAELSDDDLSLVARYLKADLEQGAGYWQPRQRLRCIETLGDVYGHAKRWEQKRGRVTTTDKSKWK